MPDIGHFTPGAYAGLRGIADSVMREGQILYPYRASAAKNQYRWIFGVALPPTYADTNAEASELGGTAAIDGPSDASVHVVVRFLRPRRHLLSDATGTAVPELDVEGELLVAFDDAELVEIPLTVSAGAVEARHVEPAATTSTPVTDRSGVARGQVTVERRPCTLTIAATSGDGSIEVVVRNETSGEFADRDDAVLHGACGVHALLEITDGGFAAPTTDVTTAGGGGGLWPSLAGAPGRRNLALLTPMVLPDHAHLAPESTGELFDGLEIEELLNLRLQTLTPTEEREIAATDPWAAAALERAGALDANDLARLHGARRSATSLARGSTVVLEPDRGVDSLDGAMRGRRATVRDVRTDHDGRVFIGVTVDDDPATPLHLARGRLFWFQDHELAPAPTGPER